MSGLDLTGLLGDIDLPTTINAATSASGSIDLGKLLSGKELFEDEEKPFFFHLSSKGSASVKPFLMCFDKAMCVTAALHPPPVAAMHDQGKHLAGGSSWLTHYQSNSVSTLAFAMQ